MILDKKKQIVTEFKKIIGETLNYCTLYRVDLLNEGGTIIESHIDYIQINFADKRTFNVLDAGIRINLVVNNKEFEEIINKRKVNLIGHNFFEEKKHYNLKVIGIEAFNNDGIVIEDNNLDGIDDILAVNIHLPNKVLAINLGISFTFSEIMKKPS